MRLTEKMLKLIPDVIPYSSDAMRNSQAGTIRRLRRLGRISGLWRGLVSSGKPTAIRWALKDDHQDEMLDDNTCLEYYRDQGLAWLQNIPRHRPVV